jgi:hypothetical protein
MVGVFPSNQSIRVSFLMPFLELYRPREGTFHGGTGLPTSPGDSFWRESGDESPHSKRKKIRSFRAEFCPKALFFARERGLFPEGCARFFPDSVIWKRTAKPGLSKWPVAWKNGRREYGVRNSECGMQQARAVRHSPIERAA